MNLFKFIFSPVFRTMPFVGLIRPGTVMRIAFDTFNLGSIPSCGSKTYTIELIKALTALKPFDTWRLITYQRKKQYCQELFKSLENVSVENSIPHPLSLGRQLLPLVKMTAPFFERKVARQCDLFHCTNQVYFPRSITNIVTTIHDLIPLREEPWVPQKSKELFKKRIAVIIKQSISLFASSDFTRSEIIRYFPEAEAKTLTIPLAVSSIFTTIPCDRSFLVRYGISDTARPYLLYVGQIQTRKNILSTIKAFESLGDRLPYINLVLIGQVSGGEYPGQVFRHAAQSALRDRIIFLHTVPDEDIVRFYNQAHATVNFSFFEGFGLPVIEAMACGCPVACSRASSMTEIAEGAAVLVDPCDFESMRQGLLEICGNSTLRDSLRKKGLERAAGYSWRRTAELTYEGYEKALGR